MAWYGLIPPVEWYAYHSGVFLSARPSAASPSVTNLLHACSKSHQYALKRPLWNHLLHTVVNVAKLAIYYTRVVNSYIHAFRRCVGEIYYTRVVNFGTCVEGGAWKCVCVVHCIRVRELYSALGWWRGWGEPRCLCVGGFF